MRAVAALALVCGLFESLAYPAGRVWTTAEDFKGGSMYGAQVSPASGDAHITLRPHAFYGCLEDASYTKMWTRRSENIWDPNDNPNLKDLEYSLGNHAAVVCGDFIYVIGGCQYETGGCGVPGSKRTVASVYYKKVLRAENCLTGIDCFEAGDWVRAAYDLGQTAGATKGIPTREHVAVAVGNRIYVIGGATTDCGGADLPTALTAVPSVYSTAVDPVTGQIGPWVRENSLPLAVTGHTAVYSCGAIFVLGGLYPVGNYKLARQDVQRADIGPDGHLGEWDLNSTKIVPASLPSACSMCGGSLPYSCPACVACSNQCNPDPLVGDACCIAMNACMGWTYFTAFSAMRTIGFLAGAFQDNPASNPCYSSKDAYYTCLDDCNRPVKWERILGTNAYFNSSNLVFAGALISAGGQSDATNDMQNILYSWPNQNGVDRSGVDGAELMPVSPTALKLADNKDVVNSLPVTATRAPLVTVGDFAYLVGGSMAGDDACSYVYRAKLATATYYVDAGHYLSSPQDVYSQSEPSIEYRLTRVSWSFTKTGDDSALGMRDDWVCLRYRVAGAGGKWTCWSPRFPEAGSMPASPGAYSYDSNAVLVAERMPMFQDSFRYIQFEVSLYNNSSPASDDPDPTLPQFTELRIEYEPVIPPPSMSGCVRVYPNPARDWVKVRYEVASSGGEVAVKVFNVAGEMVRKNEYRYLSGGFKEEMLETKGMAAGAYVVLVDGLSGAGEDPIRCRGGAVKIATGKFVVRRR